MAKYTLFAKGGKVQGKKKLKDGNFASHKISLEQDGKTKKYFVAYVNVGDDRVANFYDLAGNFVMDMKVSDAGKLVSDGKLKKIMDYEVPRENVKVREVSVKDMSMSEMRSYIQDKYIDEIKIAEFYFNIYDTGDSIEFVDDSIRDQHIKIFEDNADYLEKDFEKKTGLKIDGWEMQDEDGNELNEVDAGNTYNWSYLGGADFNYRVYESPDKEKYYLMALPHMGGDIRGNYGDAFIFEGDSQDEVIQKFHGLLSGGATIYIQFKGGDSLMFHSEQDSDVWYFRYEKDDDVKGIAKEYLNDFESFGGWQGDEFLEATIEEFHQGKKVRSYMVGGHMARGGVFEVGRFYKAKDGKTYRFLGSKYFMGGDGQYKELEVEDFYAKGGETKRYLNYYEIYDEGTGKSLNIQAHSFEEAEEIASTIEFENFRDGEDIEFGEMAKGGETKDSKIVKRRYLEGRGKNVFTFGYGMPKDSYDMFGTKGGTEYFIMPNGKVYKKTKENMNLFEFIGTQDDYAKGGKTHKQGYDDREDESLAMRHGKISSKDFVGSRHEREHSRRDDARFETRN